MGTIFCGHSSEVHSQCGCIAHCAHCVRVFNTDVCTEVRYYEIGNIASCCGYLPATILQFLSELYAPEMVQCSCINDRLSLGISMLITESQPACCDRLDRLRLQEKATLSLSNRGCWYEPYSTVRDLTEHRCRISAPTTQKRSELQNRLRFEVKRRARIWKRKLSVKKMMKNVFSKRSNNKSAPNWRDQRALR